MNNNSISKTQVFLTLIIIGAIVWLVLEGRNNIPDQPSPTETAVIPAATPWASVEVEKKLINESNQYYTIDAAYPVTKDERITVQLKGFVEEQIAAFKDDTSWVTDPSIESASEGSLSLDINYREDRSTHADTYIFSIVTYTGGAHGLQVTRTFAFDEAGKAIGVTDLFTNGEAGLKTVATFVQKEITKKNISDASWIAEGAAASAENYQTFVISDTGVTFVFDPYQVAPYAAGTQNILVPLSVFKGIANPAIFK